MYGKENHCIFKIWEPKTYHLPKNHSKNQHLKNIKSIEKSIYHLFISALKYICSHAPLSYPFLHCPLSNKYTKMAKKTKQSVSFSCSMSDKSELKAELERKKQRIAQIREEKKRKEEEKKRKDVSGRNCAVNTSYFMNH